MYSYQTIFDSKCDNGCRILKKDTVFILYEDIETGKELSVLEAFQKHVLKVKVRTFCKKCAESL